MKRTLCLLLIALGGLGCQKSEDPKVYTARPADITQKFIESAPHPESKLMKVEYKDEGEKDSGNGKNVYGIKFGDTTVSIGINPDDEKAVTSKFSFAEFLNGQNTIMLVQIADNSGVTAPYYLLTVKDKKLDVMNLYRPSKGGDDKRFTKGATKVGRSGYLVNNDYFISAVNVRIYPLKRQNPDERIQGIHFMNSPDRKTLVFLVGSSLYEVHYPSQETYTLALPADMPKVPEQVFPWIQNNYSWGTNGQGISFLKKNKDDNRVVDISEFKKS